MKLLLLKICLLEKRFDYLVFSVTLNTVVYIKLKIL